MNENHKQNYRQTELLTRCKKIKDEDLLLPQKVCWLTDLIDKSSFLQMLVKTL